MSATFLLFIFSFLTSNKLHKFYSKMTIRQETKTKKLRVPEYNFFKPSFHLSH